MKKLTLFVLVCAILFSLFPLRPIETEAATSAVITHSGSKKILNKKTLAIYVGEKNIRLSYRIGGKTKVKGYWSTSNKNVVSVSKDGTCVARGNGRATVRFTYYVGKKKKSIYCKFKAFTRPSEVILTDISGNEEAEIKPNGSLRFKVELPPSEEALERNAEIESNFKVGYALYGDEEATTATSLGTVDENGNVRAGGYGGTIYLRAFATLPVKNSKVKLYSNIVPISIDGFTKEEAAAEEEKKKKEAEEAAAKEKLKPARIEILPQAQIDPTTPMPRPKDKAINVYAGFKIFDGNGKDITHEPTTDMSAMSGSYRWDGMDFSVSFSSLIEKGRATIIIFNTDKSQVINNKVVFFPRNLDFSTGDLSLTYKKSGDKEVTATARINVIPQASIHKVEVKGVYKRDLKQQYVAVIDNDNVRLKKDDKIGTSGGNVFLNILPDSYYLLLKATDVYNNNVAAAGIPASTIQLLVSGSAGLELDNVTGINGGTAVAQSISPIVVDGMPYLTFPLRPAVVKEGSLDIVALGMLPYKRLITDGSTMSMFMLSGAVLGGKGRAIVNQENILEYYLWTTTGQNVKTYERVLSFLKISNPGNAARIDLLPNSDILSGAKNSRFYIRKNSAGEAEIVYTPLYNVLEYNPLIPQSPYNPGVEEITVLRGWKKVDSTSMENKVKVYVSPN